MLSCVGTDLGGFAWCDDLWSSDDDHDVVEVFSLDGGDVGWSGAEGWLGGFALGDLLAVRVDDNRRVRIERLEARPPVDDQLVARLRRVYERDIAEVELPSLCTDLIFALLVDDPTTFDEPQLPFGELCERAGLEVRAGFVAHDDALWRARRGARSGCIASTMCSTTTTKTSCTKCSTFSTSPTIPMRRPTHCEERWTACTTRPCAGPCLDELVDTRRRSSRRAGAGTSVREAVGRCGAAADRAHDRALGRGHRGGTRR